MKTFTQLIAESGSVTPDGRKLPSAETMRKYENMSDHHLKREAAQHPEGHPKRVEMEAVHAARQNWS